MEVVWTKAALRDLDQIQDFIAEDSPSAAHRLVAQLVERTNGLGDNPMSGRLGRAATTRELVIPGTPYIVAYRLRERVEILAVVHAARDWPENF